MRLIVTAFIISSAFIFSSVVAQTTQAQIQKFPYQAFV